ncbi:hypothetical protein KM043_011370 [Ampulex compressa]|nr:hypothetical protein KM043_011370 [Ampulex compressa]
MPAIVYDPTPLLFIEDTLVSSSSLRTHLPQNRNVGCQSFDKSIEEQRDVRASSPSLSPYTPHEERPVFVTCAAKLFTYLSKPRVTKRVCAAKLIDQQ